MRRLPRRKQQLVERLRQVAWKALVLVWPRGLVRLLLQDYCAQLRLAEKKKLGRRRVA